MHRRSGMGGVQVEDVGGHRRFSEAKDRRTAVTSRAVILTWDLVIVQVVLTGVP
jgi:hypothetical protein